MDLSERRDPRNPRHPWETARVLAVERIVRGLGLVRPRVLDIGCGDGYVALELQKKLELGGIAAQDIHLSDELIRELSRPGVTFVRELAAVPFRADIVLLLDVLEHVEHPEQLLREIVRERVAAGGFFVITVPAFQALFTRHDRSLRHYRRYSRRELAREVSAAGLAISDMGYLFASLVPPRAVSALGERLGLSGRSEPAEGVGNWRGGRLATAILHRALAADSMLCLKAHARGIDVPGLSIWLTCQAPS